MENPPAWAIEPTFNNRNDRPAPALEPLVLKKMDIKRVRNSGKVELDFVIPGLLAGTVGSIVATGSTGKSILSLQIAAIVCSGQDRIFNSQQIKQGRVVIFSLEDPAEITGNRLIDLCERLSPDEALAIEKRLEIYPLLGDFFNLRDEGHFAAIQAACDGARLVLIDTLSRSHDAEENSNSEMADVLKHLERLAQRSGAAVVFLHHTSKAASMGGVTEASASRGASLITDNGRWTMTMRKMKREEGEQWYYPGSSYGGRSIADVGFATSNKDEYMHFVRVSIPKANYSPPQPDFWLERGEGGVLRRVDLESAVQKDTNPKNEKTTDEEIDKKASGKNSWRKKG
jgi:RecA-family ATPase